MQCSTPDNDLKPDQLHSITSVCWYAFIQIVWTLEQQSCFIILQSNPYDWQKKNSYCSHSYYHCWLKFFTPRSGSTRHNHRWWENLHHNETSNSCHWWPDASSWWLSKPTKCIYKNKIKTCTWSIKQINEKCTFVIFLNPDDFLGYVLTGASDTTNSQKHVVVQKITCEDLQWLFEMPQQKAWQENESKHACANTVKKHRIKFNEFKWHLFTAVGVIRQQNELEATQFKQIMYCNPLSKNDILLFIKFRLIHGI